MCFVWTAPLSTDEPLIRETCRLIYFGQVLLLPSWATVRFWWTQCPVVRPCGLAMKSDLSKEGIGFLKLS
ncbi:hypothetical protein PDO_2509 [Rhizobium sp. PDO1-076]|nr:hypothetical protein PDO_2509 [Rhizobium sp. PDO1-076]